MSSKKQSVVSIGIGLIVIGAILLIFALSQPKESVESLTSASTTVSTTASTSNESTSTNSSTESNVPTTLYTDTTSQTNDTSQSSVISVSYPLNLNTCTEQELMSIKGIGESRANAIIQYREYLGGYTSTEQIKDIKGFGDSLYQKIAPYITV